MSDKLPFEGGGLPQEESSLPFAPSSEAPPLPFALNDEAPAPMPFALDAEPAIPPLPFSLDDEPTVPPAVAEAPDAAPFTPEAESKIPPLPFSLDEAPTAPAEPDPAALEAKIPPLPFSLDEPESKIPPLPFSLDDEPAAPAAAPELTGAGFLFEEGEIDSPLFKRLAQRDEPATPKMPPMNVPAMPPVAKAPAAEPPSPPPFPPAMGTTQPPAEAQSRPVPPPVSASEPPSPPPPPGYQPPPPPPPAGYRAQTPPPTFQPPTPPPATYNEPARPVPPAVPAFEPVQEVRNEAPPAQPAVDLSDYVPMQPAAASRAPILTGDAIPQHEAPPVAKDVSSALAAMKARLASTRPADPTADLLKEASPETGLDMSLAPKSSKAPEIWEYRVGQSIFREGELTFELFMLMEGILDVYVGGDKVATLNAETAAGAYLGEVGALLRLPRTATVKAVTSCKFLVFPDAKRLFEEDPEFGIKLSTILAQRLAQTNERMEMAMRALYRAKVKDEVITAVKGAFQGKESTYVGKKGWFG